MLRDAQRVYFEMESIRREMHSPEVVSDGQRLHACYERMQSAESEIAGLYARWAELEEKQQQPS